MRIYRKVLRAVKVMFFFQQQTLNLLLDLFFCFVPCSPRDEEMLWLRQCSAAAIRIKETRRQLFYF